MKAQPLAHWGFLLAMLISTDSMAQLSFLDITNSQGIAPGVPGDAHGSGVTLVDVDQDGDLDLYLGTERGYPDRLYLRDGADWVEVSERLGLADSARTRMVLWFDYNGDQRLDVLLAGDCDFDDEDCPDLQALRLYRQRADFTFIEVTEVAGLLHVGPTRKDQTLGGMVVGDINVDGYLDLVVALRNGELYVLLNQDGDRFVRRNAALDISTAEGKYYQPFLIDLDQNQLPDLVCNVDFGPNELWRQLDPGSFEEIALFAKANSAFNEMGIAAGDYDNDGDFDLYATNIENFLGNDVYNVFLENGSVGEFILFEEKAKTLGVNSGGWGWGTTFLDADRDGWLDLATTNGWNVGFPVIDQSKLWHQQSGTFVDVSITAGFADSLLGNALLAADFDQDGDLDLFQGLKGSKEPQTLVRILENQSSNDHHYLTVLPRMLGTFNYWAIGAVVKVYTGGLQQMRQVHAGTSFYSQEPAEAFFGLGTYETADSVVVEWPGGARSVVYGVAADQRITLLDTDVVHSPVRLTGFDEPAGYRLVWEDYGRTETGYELQRASQRDFSDAIAIPLPANTTTYTDRVVSGAVYYYRIRAVGVADVKGPFSRVLQTGTITDLPLANSVPFQVYPNPVAAGSPMIVMGANETDFELVTLQGKRITDQLVVDKVPEGIAILLPPNLVAGLYGIRQGPHLLLIRVE